MRKVYKMADLDCPNCAAKMENAIAQLPGVKSVTVSFLTQKMTLVTEADDQTRIAKEAARICSSVDSDCRVIL